MTSRRNSEAQVKHARPPANILIIGFGAIGQGLLPLLLRHLDISPDDIVIITPDDSAQDVAEQYEVGFIQCALTEDNYGDVLGSRLRRGSFVLNLAVGVSSCALIALCRKHGALYLDTCIEPWPGLYGNATRTPAERTNYAMREAVLALRNPAAHRAPTAVVAHGANPGMVSHLVKQALLNLHHEIVGPLETRHLPAKRADWAQLAMSLGIRLIQIAERDSQVSRTSKQPGEFVNTWSGEAFAAEATQPAELGWGSHERQFPADGRRHESGCGAAIYLSRPGASQRVRSWAPLAGEFHGFLITHNEVISIADYFTITGRHDQVRYRPTCHYAYHPCDNAVLSLHELAGRNYRMQDRQRLMRDDIVIGGIDELGVLLCGHARNAYWFGSQLSIDEARQLAPHNSATSLQVCAGVLGGMVWAIENPHAGIVEAEDMDFSRVIEVAAPYFGKLTGYYTDWTPLSGRSRLFPDELARCPRCYPYDPDDPWQFGNVRVP